MQLFPSRIRSRRTLALRVVRADGSVEDLGVVAEQTDREPFYYPLLRFLGLING
jgi:hypothetical protein